MYIVAQRLEKLDKDIIDVTTEAKKFQEAWLSATDLQHRADLMDVWQQLQNKKKMLLARRKALEAQLTGTGMQQFAEKAAAAKVVGYWLELPEGAYFLGDAELGSFMYVRKAYRLLRLALRKSKSVGFDHVVVSGNPGVGKAWFAMFMLVWWLKLGRSVIWHSSDAFYIFENGAVGEVSTEHATWRLGCDKRVKYVAVGVSPVYKPLTAEQSVVAHSYDLERFKEYMKPEGHLPSPLWMPIWDADELEELRSRRFPQIDSQLGSVWLDFSHEDALPSNEEEASSLQSAELTGSTPPDEHSSSSHLPGMRSSGGLAAFPGTAKGPSEFPSRPLASTKPVRVYAPQRRLHPRSLSPAGLPDQQVWVCGDYVITDSAYQLHTEYNATCQPACMDSSAALSLPTQYYWTASDWGACSAACDGGVQTRTVACMNSLDGSQANNILCDASAKPSNRRPCNATSCAVEARGLKLRFTPWSACEAECGDGYNGRSAVCANADGIAVDPTACSDYSGEQLSGSCAAAPCSKPHWRAAAWSRCNATCGGGGMTRALTCIGGDGAAAADAAAADPAAVCRGVPSPAASAPCNTAPCVGYTWQVGAWGNCSLPCGGGIMERSVQCVDEQGDAFNDTQCAGVRPADQLQCNVLPCDFCSLTNCAGQGVCKKGVCVCQPGFRGSYCEIPPTCSGILDQAGNCCPTGVVSQNGTCCPTGAVLDRHSRCCNSGHLDACGECDGQALLVDVENSCCVSGALDAAGYCCASGALDECGVCDGDASSCALHGIADVQVLSVSSYLTLGSYTFAASVEAFLSALLAINASHIAVNELVLAPGSTIGQGTQSVNLRVDFTATPADSSSTPIDLRAAQATRALQDAVGQGSASQLFVLVGTSLVARAAICGNQVCEPGERAPADANNLGCPGDCPFGLVPCPSPSGGTPCGGHGFCLSAWGTCQCWIGYAGADCSQCAEGYIRSGQLCTRYVRADLPLLNLSSKAGLDSVLGVGIALIALALIMMCIMAGILMRTRRKQRRKKKGKKGGMASREPSTQNNFVEASGVTMGAAALNSEGTTVATKRTGKAAESANAAVAALAVTQSGPSMRPIYAYPHVRPATALKPAAVRSVESSATGKPGPSVKGGGRGNFRAEDAAAAAAPPSRGDFTLEEAIKARRTDAAAADRAAAPAPAGRDEGAGAADRALSPAASGLSSEGSGPASWPLLGGAQAKRTAALDAARSRSGRLL
ncbi:probable disintegrin and metalloproteinase with thrombospondin mo at N-terminal half [Coccomyxa sp. Obi]|nr:probable disintegrin and metalloproteinase with thrombospondin mo at N-terminal half [Coccomyxa sp. Obi]